MANTVIVGAQKIDTAARGQASQALIVQNFSNSVLQQTKVDFSGFKNLAKYQTDINTGLATAQAHANRYLNEIQPNIIKNVANINNYYALNSSLPTALPPGSTVKQWLEILNTIKDQSIDYQKNASAIVSSLQQLHGDLATDSAAFAKVVSELNAAVEGDNGVLAEISGQLGDIQGKIDGAIAGIVLSGLAIIGGIFMTLVGAVAEFVTGGAATALVVGGIAVIAAGVGGEVGSALALKGLMDAQAELLTKRSNLKAEVKLALGISKGYSALTSKARAAVDAASAMQNAWEFLSNDLTTLASDLEKGTTNTGAVRTLFLTAANSVVQNVLTDTNIIKSQMTGVHQLQAPEGTRIGDFAVEIARKHAA